MDPLATIRSLIAAARSTPATPADGARQLPAAVMDLLRREPVTLPDMGLVLTVDPAVLALPAGTDGGCVDGRFQVIGLDQTDTGYPLAVDLADPSMAVCTIETEPAGVITVIASSPAAFFECLAAAIEHARLPRYRIASYFNTEHALRERLAGVLGGDLNRGWWAGHLMLADTRDTYWAYLTERQDPVETRTMAMAEINYIEAAFGLFSIIPSKVRNATRYFQLREDPAAIPLFLDLLTVTAPGSEAEALFMAAVANCRAGALPYLVHALTAYPHPQGRAAAARLLAMLNWTPLAEHLVTLISRPDSSPIERQTAADLIKDHGRWLIEQAPAADVARQRLTAPPAPVTPAATAVPEAPPPLYPVGWPPIDESDMARTKVVSALFILLAVFLAAGVFYIKTGYWLSMVLGAAAAAGAMFFLPDISLMILERRLRHAGYADRILDTERDRARIDTLVTSGDVARCIDFAGQESANSLGFLIYLNSDLAQNDMRPRVLLCDPDEYAATVEGWYTAGHIPHDGLRKPAIRAFWAGMPGTDQGKGTL